MQNTSRPEPIPSAIAIPLERLQGMSAQRQAALRELWVTTVQDLLALADTPAGRAHLQTTLAMKDTALEALLERGRRMLQRDDEGAKAMDDVMQLQYGSGAWEPPPAQRAGEIYDTIAFAGELPSIVNYVDSLPPPRNQGVRGTCVAHAAAAVREFLEIQAGAAQPDEINLSEQFIYWWCKQKDGLPHISGTYPHLGMACLAEIGTTTEDVWPYSHQPRVGNEDQGPPPPQALAEAWRYKVKRVITLDPNDVGSLKTVLADGKPIVFAIPIFDSWYQNRVTRRFGKINMPLPGEKANGAHAMVLVGYVDDEEAPGGGYFILRNSWAPWGYENPLGESCGAIPYGFLAAHCLSATTGDRMSLADVFIRDNEEDQGETPSKGMRFNSPDVWVRLAQDGVEEHQMPRAGEPAWVYVRAWNAGPREATGVKTTIYQAPASPSIWPHAWQDIGEVEFAPIPAGESALATLSWTPASDGPFCFFVRLSSQDDPVQHEWSVRNDNNLAQKNLITLRLHPGESADFSFPIFGLPGEITRMDLDVDRRGFRRGKVEVRMAERPRRRGVVQLVEDEARLADLAVEATASEDVQVGITADDQAQTGEKGEIIFTQHKGRLLIGRLIVQVEIV